MTLRFILMHASFGVLAVFFVAALIVSKSSEVTFTEGRTVPLTDASGKAIPGEYIRLDSFNVSDVSNGGGNFVSRFTLTGQKLAGSISVSVNHPSVILGNSFYQKSYSLDFLRLLISFEGREIDALSLDGPLVTKGKELFFFMPSGGSGRELIYAYEFHNAGGEVLEKGYFYHGSKNSGLLLKTGFSILEEKYSWKSIITVACNPVLTFLGVSSVSFLVLLGICVFIPSKPQAGEGSANGKCA